MREDVTMTSRLRWRFFHHGSGEMEERRGGCVGAETRKREPRVLAEDAGACGVTVLRGRASPTEAHLRRIGGQDGPGRCLVQPTARTVLAMSSRRAVLPCAGLK